MPKISVIVPTNRVGGIDIIFAGLVAQEEKDFELVLVDDLWARRVGGIAELARQRGIRVVHCEPDGSQHSTISGTCVPGHYQNALNTGITRSSGEIAVILCDYTALDKACLARHLAFHVDYDGPGSKSLVGGLDYVTPPSLHSDLPLKYGWLAMGHDPTSRDEEHRKETYVPWLDDAERMRLLLKWWEAYEADLGAKILDPFMLSTYESRLEDLEAEVRDLGVYHHEKADLPEGPIAYQYCNLKNNSFLMEDLLAANGLDEAMDGCHVYQDSELAGRLQATLKTKFVLDHACKAYMFDPHGIAIIRRMEALEKRNLDIYNAKATTGRWTEPVNPDKSLRTLRMNMLAR